MRGRGADVYVRPHLRSATLAVFSEGERSPINIVKQERSSISARFDMPLSNLLDRISEHKIKLIITV